MRMVNSEGQPLEILLYPLDDGKPPLGAYPGTVLGYDKSGDFVYILAEVQDVDTPYCFADLVSLDLLSENESVRAVLKAARDYIDHKVGIAVLKKAVRDLEL